MQLKILKKKQYNTKDVLTKMDIKVYVEISVRYFSKAIYSFYFKKYLWVSKI